MDFNLSRCSLVRKKVIQLIEIQLVDQKVQVKGVVRNFTRPLLARKDHVPIQCAREVITFP